MDEGGSNSGGGGGSGGGNQQQQHLLLQKQQQQKQQQQMYLFQQYQQQQQHQQQQQQQQQQAISRFPSNIDAHLRAPTGFRSIHPPQPQPQPPQQQQQARPGGAGGMRPPQPQQLDMELALQDAIRVCNPDVKRPFANLEDAILRLLPYHVVSDYEAEEDDRILDSDTTGQIPSRLQQWDHNILTKIGEFTNTFEKQVLAFNIMSRKRAVGEFRSEERLMIEQALLQEEKQALREIQEEVASRERAGRDAQASMRMAMAQAEHARVEAQAQAQAEMIARGPMRASALVSHADEGPGQEMGHVQGGNEEEMMHGWGNAQREEDDPSEDFLNDDNEPENDDAGLQEEWRDGGELDLNTR